MRHGNAGRSFGRTSSHRKATMQAVAVALFKHELIRTTVPKAKELRRLAEPLITRAKEDSVHNRRIAFSRLRDRDTVQKLFNELRTVAGQGFAVDESECEDGLHCLAAPVRDGSGQTIGAISISGPAFRLPKEAMHAKLSHQVLAAADRLSLELGAGAGAV